MTLKPWQRLLIWSAAAAVLLTVFAWYLQPEFMISLADQVWACF